MLAHEPANGHLFLYQAGGPGESLLQVQPGLKELAVKHDRRRQRPLGFHVVELAKIVHRPKCAEQARH